MLVVALAQVGLLLLVAAVFDGVSVDGIASAALGVAVLALLNALVWPLAIRVTAPILFLTVGLFSFVVNAFLVWLMSELVDGLEVSVTHGAASVPYPNPGCAWGGVEVDDGCASDPLLLEPIAETLRVVLEGPEAEYWTTTAGPGCAIVMPITDPPTFTLVDPTTSTVVTCTATVRENRSGGNSNS